jgi:hypothetical protein
MDLYIDIEEMKVVYAVIGSRVIHRQHMTEDLAQERKTDGLAEMACHLFAEIDEREILVAKEMFLADNPTFKGGSIAADRVGETEVLITEAVEGVYAAHPDAPMGVPADPYRFVNEEYDPEGAAGIRSFSHS